MVSTFFEGGNAGGGPSARIGGFLQFQRIAVQGACGKALAVAQTPVVPKATRTSAPEVIIVGCGPTGLMLAAELALARIDVVILERRSSGEMVGTRARGVHARTIELFDQRGIADRLLAEGQIVQQMSFAGIPLDIAGLPTRHPYTLGLSQSHLERILRDWVVALQVPIRYGADVTGFHQDDDGVDVRLGDGSDLRASYLVGADGGRSVIRQTAGIDFPGAAATRSYLSARARSPSNLRPESGRTTSGSTASTQSTASGWLGSSSRSGRWDRPARPPQRISPGR